MKVVNLGPVRDLLTEWDKVRQAIVARRVDGFYVDLLSDGEETIFLGGIYKTDPSAALQAVLNISATRVMQEDPPLASNHL
jgi:hypothetical protein